MDVDEVRKLLYSCDDECDREYRDLTYDELRLEAVRVENTLILHMASLDIPDDEKRVLIKLESRQFEVGLKMMSSYILEAIGKDRAEQKRMKKQRRKERSKLAELIHNYEKEYLEKCDDIDSYIAKKRNDFCHNRRH